MLPFKRFIIEISEYMKKISLLIIVFFVGLGIVFAVSESQTERKAPTFEDAIAIIKKYEGLSGPNHWPFVGYGHKVMPGEKFTRGKKLTEAEADALARADYAKLCAKYREFGADSLLLAALAYNCGPGVVAKSSVLSKLKAGNRDIESAYLAHCRYKGKQLSQLKRRRQEELAVLFVKDPAALHDAGTSSGEKMTETAEVVTEIIHLSSPEHPEEKKDSVKNASHN